MIKKLILLFFAAAVIGGVALYAVNNQVTAQTGSEDEFVCACASARPCSSNTHNIFLQDLGATPNILGLAGNALCPDGIERRFELPGPSNCRYVGDPTLPLGERDDNLTVCGPGRVVVCNPSSTCVDGIPSLGRGVGSTRDQAAQACLDSDSDGDGVSVAPVSPTTGDRSPFTLACGRLNTHTYEIEEILTSCYRDMPPPYPSY